MKQIVNDENGGPAVKSGGSGPVTTGFNWGWLILLFFVINWIGTYFSSRVARDSLTYSRFVAAVRQGNIDSVTFQGDSIEGKFKKPVKEKAPATLLSHAGFTSYSYFTTVTPPTGDPTLLPELQKQKITISAKSQSTPWIWNLISILILPLGMAWLLWTAYRGMRSGGSTGGPFGFGQSKARLYNEESPRVRFIDVAGEEESKQELTEIVDFLKHPQKYHKLGGKIPKGVLLVGPPGTGKTLLARAVAGEAGVPFFSISASEFVEMFVGVGASRVRNLFSRAKAASPSIIFLDEIDAVGRQRGAGLGGGNDEREQTLNQLLVEMDGFDPKQEVIVLAASNRPDVLDPALLRPGRFDRRVTIGLPDRRGREGILRIHSREVPLAPDVDLGILARATPGMAGADLANLVNEAALLAARRGKEVVESVDFDDALDKVVLGVARSTLMSDEERQTVAYHEAGHAVVAMHLPYADPVNKVTIIPRGLALGVTEQLPEDDRHNYPKEYLDARLCVMLGGRSAEEESLGRITTGAENDLKEATRLARRMVTEWGMSERLGTVAYRVGEEHPFLGREMSSPRDYSEATAAIIDDEVRALVQGAHAAARSLLQNHRDRLEKLVKALLAEETVGRERLAGLMGEDLAELPDGDPPALGLDLRGQPDGIREPNPAADPTAAVKAPEAVTAAPTSGAAAPPGSNVAHAPHEGKLRIARSP